MFKIEQFWQNWGRIHRSHPSQKQLVPSHIDFLGCGLPFGIGNCTILSWTPRWQLRSCTNLRNRNHHISQDVGMRCGWKAIGSILVMAQSTPVFFGDESHPIQLVKKWKMFEPYPSLQNVLRYIQIIGRSRIDMQNPSNVDRSSPAGTEIQHFYPEIARHPRSCWYCSVPFWQVVSGI